MDRLLIATLISGICCCTHAASALTDPSNLPAPASSPARSTPTPASSPAAGSAATSPPPVTDAYTLGAGDRIKLDVFQAPQYGGEFIVLANGSIPLPVVGAINLKGLTVEEASRAISASYANLLRRPLVTVSLLAARPVQIGIAGEVNQPGSYTVVLEGDKPPSLSHALELAGGIRQSADMTQVEIHRPTRSGTPQIIPIDLSQLLRTGNLQYDVALRDGDAIVIPTDTTPDLTQANQIADASFAAQSNAPINVVVVGQVFRPGSHTVTGTAWTAEAGNPGDMNVLGTRPTVTRALQVAGGITPTADVRTIQIRRMARSGMVQTFDVNLWQLLAAGDLSQDVILQDRDTIVIPTAAQINPADAAAIASASFSPNTIKVNVVGEVTTPGVVEVAPNTPLNQAIFTAGGFNNRANRRSVELIRLNADGTVSQQQITVDLAQGVNDQKNPALRHNDVVVVRRSGVARVGDALEAVANPIGRFFSIFTLPFGLFR